MIHNTPAKIFLTRGIGRDKYQLKSFEEAQIGRAHV